MAYQVQSADTTYEAEQVQIAIFRKRGPAGRGKSMLSLTSTTHFMSRNNFFYQRPNISRQDCTLLFLRLIYGEGLAKEVANYFEHRTQIGKPFQEDTLLSSDDLLAAISPVVDVLDALGVNYLIGGSVASSIHGIPRATYDADLVADFRQEHVVPFIARLQDDYYVSETAIQDALTRRTSSFNLIHNETGYKIDLFILMPDQFDQASFSRAVLSPITSTSPRLFKLNSAEDILLRKLDWYRQSNYSEKQWLDILGILKNQEQLDYSYLEEWAKKLNLEVLLDKAKDESGR